MWIMSWMCVLNTFAGDTVPRMSQPLEDQKHLQQKLNWIRSTVLQCLDKKCHEHHLCGYKPSLILSFSKLKMRVNACTHWTVTCPSQMKKGQWNCTPGLQLLWAFCRHCEFCGKWQQAISLSDSFVLVKQEFHVSSLMSLCWSLKKSSCFLQSLQSKI